jgi:hypothetical protein
MAEYRGVCLVASSMGVSNMVVPFRFWLRFITFGFGPLRPTPIKAGLAAELMEAWPVSQRVSQAGEEGGDLIQKVV